MGEQRRPEDLHVHAEGRSQLSRRNALPRRDRQVHDRVRRDDAPLRPIHLPCRRGGPEHPAHHPDRTVQPAARQPRRSPRTQRTVLSSTPNGRKYRSLHRSDTSTNSVAAHHAGTHQPGLIDLRTAVKPQWGWLAWAALLVFAALDIEHTILAVAAWSLLGLGYPPPTPEGRTSANAGRTGVSATCTEAVCRQSPPLLGDQRLVACHLAFELHARRPAQSPTSDDAPASD